MVPARLLLFLFLLTTSALQAPAQAIYAENQMPARGVDVEYTVAVRNPVQHLYDVEMLVKGIRETAISVSMPAWEPGRYTILDYAKNVQDFRAVSGRGQPLKWDQTDKQTWRISKAAADDVTVRYQVFSRLLTDQMADMTAASTFMYVVGQKHVPYSVKYSVPGNWKVYTGLEKRGDRYHAGDYDIFVDAPAFIGEFKVLEFQAAGANHRLVFSKPDISMTAPQVEADVKEIVEAAIAIFGKPPYKEYTFLFKVQPQSGNSGLEHLNSTRITVGENDFVSQTTYRDFLGTVAHEFFHLWNVKRIRPKGLGPLLDLEIRARTKNQKSLDDVMRYLMENYANKGVGFPEDGFLQALSTVAGSDFAEFYQMTAQSRQELDYNRYLKQAGLSIEVVKQSATLYVGIEFD